MDIHVYIHDDHRDTQLLERLLARFDILERHMTAQTDKLIADVTALITEAVNDITAAIAAAQTQSPDPAIDTLDGQVTAATQKLKDAIATLPGTAPATPAARTPGL